MLEFSVVFLYISRELYTCLALYAAIGGLKAAISKHVLLTVRLLRNYMFNMTLHKTTVSDQLLQEPRKVQLPT